MIIISLRLPDNTMYAAGYINDVATVFWQDTLNTQNWRAEAENSETDLYHIVLELYDEDGNVGHYDEVIEYIFPVFVCDRSQTDVDRVSELRNIGWQNMSDAQRAEWLNGLKGCLNRSDLKRIENDIYVIAQQFGLNIRTSRGNLPELPDTSYFERMLDNVRTLRNTGYIHTDTPEVPSQPINTYQKVNDIEHILRDIYEIHTANHTRYLYCGEICAGDAIGLL